MKVRLVKTCDACPEQYDAYIDGRCVGYLRLRHGFFRCEYLPTDEVVYSSSTNGDGIFEHNERRGHLNSACSALIAADVAYRNGEDFTVEDSYFISGDE